MLAGLLSGAGQIGESWMKYNQQMDLMREKMAMETSQRRADKTWELDEGEKRQQGLLSRTDARAQEIAGSRVMNSPEDIAQSDAAAKAYSDAAARGDISQEDANLGYGAASDYLKRNEQKNTAVTDDDRLQAARDTGALSEKDYIAAKSKDSANEMKLMIAQGRFENAIQIAQMKGDFSALLAEAKAEAKSGNAKASDFVAGMAELDVRFPKASQADKLKMWQNRNAGEKGYTDTEYDEDGRVSGRKTRTPAGNTAAPPAGRSFVWQGGKLVPK